MGLSINKFSIMKFISAIAMYTKINFILLFVIFSSVFCGNGYYWRDWYGTVPSDAYIVANDSERPVYFAQAYIYNTGLFVGNIEENQHSIALNPTTGNGPAIYSNVLKIFCSSSTNSLMWLASNTTLTPKLIKFVQPVLGGITHGNGTVYIGRYFADGLTYVGSIHTDNYLYYTKPTGEAAYIEEYEILIHEFEMTSGCDEENVPPV